MKSGKANISLKPGIYLHIPFCERKCAYCDFYSVTNLTEQTAFVQALCQEIEHTAQQLQPQEVFDTIYFGGGTPSLLSVKHIEQILNTLHRNFQLEEDCEITLEMNPGATEQSKLPLFRELGINRLSIGVQSFNDTELNTLGRIHNALLAKQAIDAARKAGFSNISLDLIYALPNQSLKTWEHTLTQAVQFEPQHLSTYNLIFEPGTPFYEKREKGQLAALSSTQELRFFNFTHQFLEAEGYQHYEVSNFARSAQHYSRHNFKYWLHVPYLGFGPSAHSYWNGKRWANLRSLSAYLKQLAQNKTVRAFEEVISPKTEEFEHIFLRLRTYRGLELNYFEKRFQRSFYDSYRSIIEKLIEQQFAVLQNGTFRLTQQGMAVCDEIVQYFA